MSAPIHYHRYHRVSFQSDPPSCRSCGAALELIDDWLVSPCPRPWLDGEPAEVDHLEVDRQ